MPAKKKAKETALFPEEQLFEMGEEFEDAKERSNRFEKKWRDIQKVIVEQMDFRKVKSIVRNDGYKLTRTARETLVYDEEGIWSGLKPAQRRRVFKELVDLNALPPEQKKAVYEALEAKDRKAVTSYVLDSDALSREVQEGKISETFAAEFTTIKESAPWIVPSKGTGE